MANKSITNPTAERIFRKWKEEGDAERPRTYLGASVAGHECDMYLWLNFRGVVREKFEGRMYRLFNRGQREEAVFCDDLRRIGCEVKDRDESTGQQFGVTALGGHFAGHLDAIARGFVEAPKAWHVCEFKTHSDSSFRKLCKDGVAKAKPMHYAQMQCYMGLTGLERAFYMAVDKDNDDLWCERVNFDEAAYERIMARAKHVIDTCQPERCAKRMDDFRCKACACRSVCWHEAPTLVDPSVPLLCRTCCHATAVTDGEGARWTCRLGRPCGTDMTCDRHMILPVFVSAEIVDGSESAIVYDACGKRFSIGAGGLSGEEAKKVLPGEVDGLMSIKESAPGATVVASNALAAKYAKMDCSVDFSGSVEGLKDWCAKNTHVDWSKPSAKEEICGKRFFEYDNHILVTIDGGRARVISENPPF